MKVLTSRIVVCAIMSIFASAGVVYADHAAIDYKVVTSKAYVDNEVSAKQDAITTGLVELYDGEGGVPVNVPAIVVTNADGTALTGNEIGLVSQDKVEDDYGDGASIMSYAGDNFYENFVPTIHAVTTGINAALDGKQDIITTGLINVPGWVPGTQTATNVPSIVSYDTTNGVAGNVFGLLNLADYAACSASNAGNGTCNWRHLPSNLVMTADLIRDKVQLKLGPKSSGANDAPAGGQTIDLGPVAGNVNMRYITAGGSVGLTTRTGAPAVINYVNGTVTPSNMTTFTTNTFGTNANQDFIKGALVSLELLKDSVAYMKNYVFPQVTQGDYEPIGGQVTTLTDVAGVPEVRYITYEYGAALSNKPYYSNLGANEYKSYVQSYLDGTTTLNSFADYNFGSHTTESQDKVQGALVNLETLRGAYEALQSEITATRPTGTPNTIANYDSNGALGDGIATYSGPTAQNPYNATNDAAKIATAGFVETKQDKLTARAQNAPVTIPTYPAYGQTNGTLGQMLLDTTTLYTTDDSHFPSSKLLNTRLGLYLPKADVYNTANLNSDLSTNYTGAPSWATSNGVASLYRIPSAASGSNWAATALSTWASNPIVPTMDTLANALAGLYNAVGGAIGDHVQTYSETGNGITSANIAIPSQIGYTGATYLSNGNQLFWLPQLVADGNANAITLMQGYDINKVVPSMAEVAHALDGLLQTRENTAEWLAVANSTNATTLYELRGLIASGNSAAVQLNNTGYLQTFAPTLETLMNESYALDNAKQDKLSGTEGYLVTYGATSGQTSSKAIATSIANNANTVPNTQAVYNAVNARQNIIPVAGKYRASNTATSDTPISNWTAANIKGTALVTKPTDRAGVVGERKIFEAGTTYTNNAATNIQIATIGAVMENTVTKTCVGWRPGTPVAQQNATTCWLWEFADGSGTAASCINPSSCRGDADCCSGSSCSNGWCVTNILEL